jgi:hypothetical protein
VREQFASIALRIRKKGVVGAAVIKTVGEDRHVGELTQCV